MHDTTIATEREIFERLRSGDSEARATLTRRYLPLARSLARRYQRSDEPFDDLLQVAALGLVKAVDRFDPDRGIGFSTYAVPTITGELKRYFRDRTWSVRVPRDLQELALRVEREAAESAGELHHAPTAAELATRLGLSEDEVQGAIQARTAHRSVSLDAPRAGEDGDRGETLGDAITADDEAFLRAEERALLERLLRTVSPREREVVRLRFDEDLTQAEIGQIVGVSQMQVSRILRRAVDRMRLAAAGEAVAPDTAA